MNAHRGGSARLVAKAASGTLDPHINYTLQYWQLYQPTMTASSTSRRRRALKASPSFPISPKNSRRREQRQDLCLQDPQRHQILRRPGTRRKDVVASFQRIFKVSSPTAGGFYSGIVGADKCLAEPQTCTLEGGVVGDEAREP